MVAGAVVGVRLDRVTGQCTELGPAVEEPRVGRDDGRNRLAACTGRFVGGGQGRAQRLDDSVGLGVEESLGEAARQVDLVSFGSVGHPSTLPDPPVRPCLTAGSIGVVTSPDTAARSSHPRRASRVVLVRHAVTPETGTTLSGRAPGIDLSDAGRAQADATAERLASVPLAAVYASPIERTTQTAELIAKRHGLAVESLPGVIEADYGEWTGAKLSDLAKTDLWKTVQAAPSRVRFPGGEAMVAMQARMVEAIEMVSEDHAGETIVVVSHADPIKAAIAHFTGLALDLFQRIAVAPSSIAVLELGTFGATLLKCNDTGSLDELASRPGDGGDHDGDGDHDGERDDEDGASGSGGGNG